MADILSQNEINQLLTAINEGKTEAEDLRMDSISRRIKIYDFKRPDMFTKDQIRSVSILHETFSRLCTAAISSLCRCQARFHVASVDQLTYEEFIRSVPTPTTLGIINMNPLIGNAAIEIDPPVTFSILSLLTGGIGEGAKEQHELTELEKLLMEDVISGCLENLKTSWAGVLDLNPGLRKTETNPQFLQIVPPTEMVVLVTIEAHIGDVEGLLNLCYPYITIEPILERLSASYYYSVKNAEALNLSTDDIEVELSVEVLRSITTFGELKKLKKDSIIKGTESKIIRANGIIIGDWDYLNDSLDYIAILLTSLNARKEIDYMSEKNNVNAESEIFGQEVLDQIEVQIICELGRTKATMKQIKGFEEGTILELHTLAGEPVNVFANNKLVAKGEVVVIDENFGVRIIESVSSKKDNSDEAFVSATQTEG